MVRPMTEQDSGSVSFGFRTVPAEHKPELVRGVFDSVARRYDLMNDLMSGGAHRLWKRAMVDWLAPRPPLEVLDLAGGTGDVAFRVLKRLGARRDGDGAGRVTVCDINLSMIRIGRDHAIDRGLLEGLSWVCGNAENIPLPDRSVDAVTIAFGIRNVARIATALGEIRRVLKPGGRFLCLEFSNVTDPLLERLYDAYSFKLVPGLGAAITGDREAYQYLVESIRRFPDRETFADMILDAGLGRVSCRALSGGIAALHSAWRL